MKKVSQTKQFGRDIKRMKKRGKDLDKLKTLVQILAEGQALPERYRDHPLVGQWRPARDSHIEPDWILIYTVDDENLRLVRTGSHSDLF